MVRCWHPLLSLGLSRVVAIAAFAALAIRWVGGLRWSTRVPRLSVMLWLTPLPKVWCRNGGPESLLGPCEVNSGDTEFLKDGSRKIRVWRAEDWSLILLHELFHAFNWDRLVPSGTNTEVGADRSLGAQIPRVFANPSEALVDAMALLAHCQLLGAPNGPTGWKPLLQDEQEWSVRQAVHVLRSSWRSRDTSVFSYFVLKAALVSDLGAFSNWLKQPTAAACQMSWNALVHSVLSNFYNRQGSKDDTLEACVPMSRARHRLSLRPIKI